MTRLRLFAAVTGAVVAFALPAAAETQPSGVGNAADRNGGASAPGPHCHYNLMASEMNAKGWMIITGTIHEAHTHTGLPTGVFQATACPAA
jgi:hypothetical protein